MYFGIIILQLLPLKGTDVQRFSLGRFESELNCFLLTFGSAEAAAHAFFKVHTGQALFHRYSIKLAEFGADTAADAELMVHL